eukprot:jgi/Chrzof1/866/Cz01g32010.t1
MCSQVYVGKYATLQNHDPTDFGSAAASATAYSAISISACMLTGLALIVKRLCCLKKKALHMLPGSRSDATYNALKSFLGKIFELNVVAALPTQ